MVRMKGILYPSLPLVGDIHIRPNLPLAVFVMANEQDEVVHV